MFDKQDRSCAACSKHLDLNSKKVSERPHIDHDHVSGNVRGMLCGDCNVALGRAKDRPDVLRTLADYVERSISCQ